MHLSANTSRLVAETFLYIITAVSIAVSLFKVKADRKCEYYNSVIELHHHDVHNRQHDKKLKNAKKSEASWSRISKASESVSIIVAGFIFAAGVFFNVFSGSVQSATNNQLKQKGNELTEAQTNATKQQSQDNLEIAQLNLKSNNAQTMLAVQQRSIAEANKQAKVANADAAEAREGQAYINRQNVLLATRLNESTTQLLSKEHELSIA